jgi:hypothetical protein
LGSDIEKGMKAESVLGQVLRGISEPKKDEMVLG